MPNRRIIIAGCIRRQGQESFDAVINGRMGCPLRQFSDASILAGIWTKRNFRSDKIWFVDDRKQSGMKMKISWMQKASQVWNKCQYVESATFSASSTKNHKLNVPVFLRRKILNSVLRCEIAELCYLWYERHIVLSGVIVSTIFRQI